MLSDAEICDFTPHSFRGASASAMLNSDATLDDILKSAEWTNASTLKKKKKNSTIDLSRRRQRSCMQIIIPFSNIFRANRNKSSDT